MLKSFIQATLPMSKEKAELIVSKFDFLKLFKFDYLIEEKNTSNYTYFLEQGFIRSYTFNAKGDEVTTNIFAGSAFVNDFLSLFKQTPARENFQALTDCKIWRMRYEDLQLCFHTIPEFREFGRMLLVTNYDILHTRVLSMIQDSAESRYMKLLETNPEIFQHIPLKIIASYLGITDTSLSRIRKDLNKK